MKRSEMLEIIVDEMMHHHPIGSHNMNEVAKFILDRIEDMGMQPPGYQGRFATGEKYKPEMGPVDVHWFKGWEPE